MTIELIDLDTGATMEAPEVKVSFWGAKSIDPWCLIQHKYGEKKMEVHGDKTSGLQFEGVPSERALRAQKIITKTRDSIDNYKAYLSKHHISTVSDYIIKERLKEAEIILEALELMAKEKINV